MHLFNAFEAYDHTLQEAAKLKVMTTFMLSLGSKPLLLTTSSTPMVFSSHDEDMEEVD